MFSKVMNFLQQVSILIYARRNSVYRQEFYRILITQFSVHLEERLSWRCSRVQGSKGIDFMYFN